MILLKNQQFDGKSMMKLIPQVPYRGVYIQLNVLYMHVQTLAFQMWKNGYCTLYIYLLQEIQLDIQT